MSSSSSKQVSGTSRFGLQVNTGSSYVIKPKTMAIPLESFEVQTVVLWNVSRNHPLLDSFKSVVLKGNSATKLVDIDGHHRMLLKFMTDCFFQKGGGSDQPSVDHKLVLYFLSTFNKINLPKYLMHHLCWAIKEGIRERESRFPVEDCSLKYSLKASFWKPWEETSWLLTRLSEPQLGKS